MGHLNVNGLTRKFDYIKLLVQKSNIDILCLNDTKIDNNIDDEDIGIDGFTLYQKDRDHGGGILIYISNLIE